jgi:hypothetical protein
VSAANGAEGPQTDREGKTTMKKLVSNVVADFINEPVIGFAEFIVIAVVITLILMPL